MQHTVLCLAVLTLGLLSLVGGQTIDPIVTKQLAQAYLTANIVRGLENATMLAELIQLEYPNYLAAIAGDMHTPKNTSIPFPCQLTGRTDPRPTNARRLLPGDVDVVASMGDSLVAAFGALSWSIITIYTEYRGHSFCGGAQNPVESFGTVPAIIKKYNPALRGYGVGTGNANSANAVLNVAVSGARSYNVMAQIDVLQNKMRDLPVGNREWKLISVFVGGNDLCDYCNDPIKNSPENFSKNIENVLDVIKARFFNVFVNLVTPPDVTMLGKVTDGFCGLLHDFECACSKDVPGTTQAHKAYTQKLFELVELPKYKDKPDFYVGLQPFFAELDLPMKDGKPDKTYFAPDCFHFSGKAHEAAAVALWNNMVELPADKKRNWVPGEPIECTMGFLS